MIRGPYTTHVEPPAPFVPVELTSPLDGTSTATVPAQIDTAADRTLVPQAVLEALGLEPIDRIPIGASGGGWRCTRCSSSRSPSKAFPGV